MELYNTKCSNLIDKLTLLTEELEELEPEILKIEEAACRLFQK